MKFTSGKKIRAQRIVIYGPESTGKTTIAAAMPDPVFLDTEDGSAHLDITRAEIHSWKDMVEAVETVASGTVQARTLVIDTIDWAEKMLAEDICRKAKKAGLEDFGYGKGYTFLAEAFSKFLRELDTLIDNGITVCILAHSTVKRFEAPDGAQPYDRYELKLSKQVSPLLKEWCDALLFLNWDTRVKQTDGPKGKAVGGKERLMHSIHSAAWDAKNRHGLPEMFPAGIDTLAPLFPRTEPKPVETVAEVVEPVQWFTAIESAIGLSEIYVNEFLVDNKAIEPGQSYRDLNEAWQKRVLERPEALVAKARQHVKSKAAK
jgi:hypothetical protein